MILWLIASRSLNWFHSLTRLDWILFLLQWAQFVCSNAIIAQMKGQSQFKCNHAIRSCYSFSALMFFGVTDLFHVAGFCCCCLFVLLWMHSNLSGKCCVSAVGGLSLGRGCLFLLTLQVVVSFWRGGWPVSCSEDVLLCFWVVLVLEYTKWSIVCLAVL